MAYDEHLADRIRAILADRADVSERKMFGGLAFLVEGHMCVGIVGSDLMARVGKDAFDKALSAPHARPMDFTGKPSTGMVYVAPPGVKTIASLRKWVERALSFTSTLPPRVDAPARRARRSRAR
jgi:TfoX/Sxy family transcriptional regulator of competence genes